MIKTRKYYSSYMNDSVLNSISLKVGFFSPPNNTPCRQSIYIMKRIVLKRINLIG